MNRQLEHLYGTVNQPLTREQTVACVEAHIPLVVGSTEGGRLDESVTNSLHDISCLAAPGAAVYYRQLFDRSEAAGFPSGTLEGYQWEGWRSDINPSFPVTCYRHKLPPAKEDSEVLTFEEAFRAVKAGKQLEGRLDDQDSWGPSCATSPDLAGSLEPACQYRLKPQGEAVEAWVFVRGESPVIRTSHTRRFNVPAGADLKALAELAVNQLNLGKA